MYELSSDENPRDDSQTEAASQPADVESDAAADKALGEPGPPTTGMLGPPELLTPAPTPPGVSPSPISPDLPAIESGELLERDGKRLEFLGRGGYGEVWAVRYQNDIEAWKFIPKEPGAAFLAFREGYNARAIRHPNVVRVLEIIPPDGALERGLANNAENYIIRMDQVTGRDLHRVIVEDGVFGPAAVCGFALQIADALQAAHDSDVLHLDLKPSNLILCKDGKTVMVTDFGISATLGEGLFQVDGQHGIHGTPHFVAPEQVRLPEGMTSVGPGVDVWALGVTLFYLMTRTYPITLEGRDLQPILETEPRSLTEVIEYAPPELSQIIARMLRRDPAERFGSMAAVQQAFREYLELQCPACSQSYQIAQIGGICPNQACPDPKRIHAFAEQRRVMMEGESHSAACDHDKAKACYERVASLEEADRQLAKRAERLIMKSEAEKDVLAEAARKIRELLDDDSLLKAFKNVEDYRGAFSASEVLRDLRDEALGRIEQRYKGLRNDCSRLVKEARFGAAKSLVMEVETFLDHEPLEQRLERIASKGRLRAGDLYGWVEECEKQFRALEQELEQRLQSLNLGKAAGSLQKLNKYFPKWRYPKTHLELRQLDESLNLVRRLDVAVLREHLRAGGPMPEGKPAEIAAARDHLRRLTEALDPKEIPAIDELAKELLAIEQLILEFKERRKELENELNDAQDAGAIRRQSKALAVLVSIADGTDLVAEIDAVRLRDQKHRVDDTIQDAEGHYTAAGNCLQRREYAAAQVELEEVTRIAPELFTDIEAKLEECEKHLAHDSEVLDDLQHNYNRILGDAVELTDIKQFFKFLEQLEASPEEDVAADLRQKIESVLDRLLALQGDVASKAVDEGRRWEALRETVAVLEMPPTSSKGVAEFMRGSEFGAAFLGFFDLVVKPQEKQDPSRNEVSGRVIRLRDAISALRRLSRTVRELKPTPYHAHPAERLGDLLVACRPSLLRRANPRRNLESLLSLHDELADLFSDDETRKALKRGQGSIHVSLRRLAFGTFLGRVAWVSKRGAVPAIAAGIGGLLVYLLLGSMGSADRGALLSGMLCPEPNKPILLSGEIVKSDTKAAEFVRSLVFTHAGSKQEGEYAIRETARRISVLARVRAQVGADGKMELERHLSEARTRGGEQLISHLAVRLNVIAERARTWSPGSDAFLLLRAVSAELARAKVLDSMLATGKAEDGGALEVSGVLDHWSHLIDDLLESRGAGTPTVRETPASSVGGLDARLHAFVQQANIAQWMVKLASLARSAFRSETDAEKFLALADKNLRRAAAYAPGNDTLPELLKKWVIDEEAGDPGVAAMRAILLAVQGR